MKPKKVMDDEDFEELLKEETGDDELQDDGPELSSPQHMAPQRRTTVPIQKARVAQRAVVVDEEETELDDDAPTESPDEPEETEYADETALNALRARRGPGRPPKSADSKYMQAKAARAQEGNSPSKDTPRRFAAYAQPERIAVVYADTGEVVDEAMPPWAARMWADLKNDIDELKDTVGKI